jgi:hypothetical protein
LFVIIDAAIFTSYYSLVLGIDVHAEENMALPSVRHALLWTIVIFVGYLTWDILVAHVHSEMEDSEYWQHRWWVSAVCSVLAYAAFVVLEGASPNANDARFVYFTDGALIALFVAFRAMKESAPWSLESWLDPYFWISLGLLIVFGVLIELARRRKP